MAEKTYLEVFREHYPNVVLKEFFGNYCPAGFFEYGMDMHHPDCTAECDKCWLCTADSEWRENGEYDVPEAWKAMAVQDKPSEPPAPVQSEASVAAAFDYSELDSDTAAKLENVTAEIFNVRKEYIFTMAKKVAYAHDLLANHYGGKFGAWCESIGITRQTANNLIQVVKLFDNSTIEEQENLNKLADGNVKLLYEAARPSAPPELVEQVKSGDITTHKDFIKLKKDLEEAEEKKEFWIKANNETNKENQQLRTDRNIALSRADTAERKLSEAEAKIKELDEYRERNAELEAYDDELQRKNDVLVLKNQELEQRIKEIENRPVDVAVQSDEDALAEKDQEISELKDEVERLSNKNVKVFAVRLTLDEYEKLVQIVCGGCRGGNDPVILEAVKKAQIIRL